MTLRRGDRVRAWVAPGIGVRETPDGPTWARGDRSRRVWMAATVVYTAGRGSVQRIGAEAWDEGISDYHRAVGWRWAVPLWTLAPAHDPAVTAAERRHRRQKA